MVKWTYIGERKWVLKEGRYNAVVMRSIKGEGLEARRFREPFDPFG
jgi:hypothetical protein